MQFQPFPLFLAWYMKDPKKILKNWLEHHGLDTDFQYGEEGQGRERVFVARIPIPVESGFGGCQFLPRTLSLVIVNLNMNRSLDAVGSGSKKRDAERECSIDACKKLDAAGLLRGDPSDLAERKKQILKSMLGDEDSDDDSFYDRTGAGSFLIIYLVSDCYNLLFFLSS